MVVVGPEIFADKAYHMDRVRGVMSVEKLDLAELKRLLEAATPALWIAEDGETETPGMHWWHVESKKCLVTEGSYSTREKDMRLIDAESKQEGQR